MVYSSRFLNAEEHLLDGRVAEAWSAMWCFLISVPLFLRTKTPRLLWNLFAIIGMGYTLAILLDAYLRARGQ